MMSLKIVALISLSLLFGSALCDIETSTLHLSVFDSSNQWWIAVKPTGGSVATSKVELQQYGSSTWSTMSLDAGWGFFQMGSNGGQNGFSFPLSFRLTASNGQQLVLTSLLSSVSAGASVDTQTQYGSSVAADSNHDNHHQPTEAPTQAPSHHHTQAPTAAPTQKATTAPTAAPTAHATAAPTQKATAAPTQRATAAPTQHATAAPTQHATAAPTQHATAAPTQKATAAPTQRATAAPTQKATAAPTQRATAAPTQKATVKPTTAPSTGTSTNLCALTSTAVEPVKLLVPLYIYPDSTWTQVANAARAGVPTIAIINPNNGPESSGPDSSYTTYMAQLTAAGVVMVGYIHTSYGDRAIADVQADINTYATKYPGLAGIFVDEASASSSDLAYYTQVYNAVKSHAGYVNTIINPGTQPDEGYLAVSTNIVIYEDIASNWRPSFSSWVTCAPDAASKADYKYKFSGIAYAGSAAQMATLVPAFASAGIGMVYVTDGAAGGDTYNSLPSFFSTMVSDIAALN